MQSLHIPATERTPEVSFNLDDGKLLLEGSSIPEDTLAFYKPLLNWMDDFEDESIGSATLEVRLKFFNTSTAKCLFGIIKKLQDIHDKGRKVRIEWHYRLKDTDMFESGLDFQTMVKVPFEIVKDAD